MRRLPLLAALSLVAALSGSTAAVRVEHHDVALVDSALVLGPTGVPMPSEGYVDTVVNNYLTPLGYTGTDGAAAGFWTPEGSTNASYTEGEALLIAEVLARWDAGEFSSDDPLWLFGYSQSATIIGNSEEVWSQAGIPADALHLVLVGDPAAPEGFVPNAPDWLLEMFGFPYLAQSVVTPGEYFDTDVFTVPGDGWADNVLANVFNLGDMAHNTYLGLDPALITDALNAGPTSIDGLTDYYTIDGQFDLWTVLWEAWQTVFGGAL